MKHDELINAVVEAQMLQFKIIIGFCIAIVIIIAIAVIKFV